MLGVHVDSIFVKDSWSYNENRSFNICFRYDKNDGTNSVGAPVQRTAQIVAASLVTASSGEA